MNSSWDEAAGEIVVKSAVNLGVAAATPRGLLVPNIKNAAELGLVGPGPGSSRSSWRPPGPGTTQPADTAQGTFTITNVGVFGVDAGTPILNPGEAGILCVADRPAAVGGFVDGLRAKWRSGSSRAG